MASHYKWYDGSMPETVPWFAKYSYPSMANKANKLTPRIPPKNGSVFLPGNPIRVEFPAQGYVNPGNTTLTFDVTIQQSTAAASTTNITHLQNGINSVFSRGRLLYGSGTLEDTDGYNVVCRALTEWTSSNTQGEFDQTSIAEGMGGFNLGATINEATVVKNIHTRSTLIQGIDDTAAPNATGSGTVPNTISNTSLVGTQCTRRYQVSFLFGMFTQGKLIPTKWMASQLAIELTLASAASCLMQPQSNTGWAQPTVPANYCISNVNLIPEILTFDSAYDEEFLRGLQNGGIPIKFSTWKRYGFSTGGSSSLNLNIGEKSRSVKAIFVVQRRSPELVYADSGALLPSSAGTIQNYQFRIGGLYFPAAPVQCVSTVGSLISNGGAEAYLELQKALNVVGDYRLSTNTNVLKWCFNYPGTVWTPTSGTAVVASEADYRFMCTRIQEGIPVGSLIVASPNCGNMGSACFAAAINLESSSGLEISGLNAEEMSDITFMANYSAPQLPGYALEAYTYVDKMLVLKENNVGVLIE